MAWLELGNPFLPASDLDTVEDRRRAIRSATLILLILGIGAMPFLWTPWIHGNDGVRNYAYCRSMWIDRDFDFRNEFDHYLTTGELPSYRVDNLTGRPGNGQAVGSAVLWSPFFWAAHVVAGLSGGPADGYGRVYALFISLGSTFYAFVGLVLLLRTIAWRFDAPSALVATLALWWGSPLWFYMYLHPSMSHSCSFFMVSLLVWMYERWRDVQNVPHFLLIGLAAGLATATRYTNGVFLLIPAAFAWKAVFHGLPGDHPLALDFRLRISLLLLGVGVIVGVFPQLAAWRYFYDAWLSGPRDYNMSTNLPGWSSPWLVHVLVSGWRGLFVWAPIAFVGLVGFVSLARFLRLIDLTLLVAFLIQLWVIGGWAVWYGGASFGQRFFINFTPLFAIGLAWLYFASRGRLLRRALVLVAFLCVVWTGGLAVQYVGGIIDREKPVALRVLAVNQFTRVPRWLIDHGRLLLPGARQAELPRPAARARQ